MQKLPNRRLCSVNSVVCSVCIAALAGGCASIPKTQRPPSEPASAGWTQVAALSPAVSPALDSDGDGIPDQRERALGSDPHKQDSDGDGFDDGFEDLFGEFGFDLLRISRDTDRDGLEDSYERRIGTNPENADTDGDGWSDFDEVLNRYFGFDPLVPTLDTDFDGLSDELERRIGSSPTNPDSNGDGVNDFVAYSAGLNPAGPRIPGGLAELTGTTYSRAMADALVSIRGGARFPAQLASELPYARITAPLVGERTRPSAALMQRSVFNPRNSPGIYKDYNEIVSELFATASRFNGSSGPDLVRLFVWSEPTVDCCVAADHAKPGRSIYAVKISANPGVNEKEPEVLFMGLHHARELITATFTMDVIARLTKGYAARDPEIVGLLDSREVWVMPVINPNGYDRVVLAQVDWRKNTRRVSAAQWMFGVDINRNYGFEHATSLTTAQRVSLSVDARASNGIDINGSLNENNETYPGTQPFSEIETQAVRGLAHSQFAGEKRQQVDGLTCSLSWHTYSGTVGHPMAHTPVIPPALGLTPTDRSTLGAFTSYIATATTYKNVFDGFEKQGPANGDLVTGYPVFGDSDDWLYKDRGTLATFIEAYSFAEGNFDSYNPPSAPERDAVSAHNVNGALALLRACRG